MTTTPRLLLATLLSATLLLSTGCPEDDPAPTAPAPTTTTGTLANFCAGPPGQTGCCVGSTLTWCENGKAIAIECGVNQCGWYTTGSGGYDCYAYEDGPNRNCPTASDEICVPTCSGRCGVSDGCGGTCGCPSNRTCQNTICIEGSQPTACEKLMHVGCCDGDTVRYCQDTNGDFVGEEQADACSNGCGWNPAGWYACGYTGADPSGDWPRACN